MPFRRVVLRTLDVPAARDFYAALFGGPPVEPVVEVPAAARARGAPPSWLVYLGVDDVDAALEAFGGVALGPVLRDPEGDTALTRDPGGAVVGLTTAPATPTRAVLSVLNTPAVAACRAAYERLMGWSFGEPAELGGVRLVPFAVRPGGPVVGALADTAGRPGVHPAWNLHFPVEDLEGAVARVEAAGGLHLPVFELADRRVVACDDPWGAAFSLDAPRNRQGA